MSLLQPTDKLTWGRSVADEIQACSLHPNVHGSILVVDDNRAIRSILKGVLSPYDVNLLEAGTGDQARGILDTNHVDLVLADVMMPGMDGFELCGKIKESPTTRDIPVIMVTAQNQIGDLRRAFELGAMDYIRKPFDSTELLLRVGNALDLKRSRDALARWNRLMSHELELAGTIQKSMFSEMPCVAPAFDIQIKYRASMDVGGDAFDIIKLPGGRYAVYLADVSGHGVAPAMISSMLKASARELIGAFYLRGPAFICNELHVRVCQTLDNPAYYATLFLALYEPESQQWTCMNCGHPDPILIRAGRRVAFPSGGGGIPVGMAMGPERPYEAADQTVLGAGDHLQMLLYSDGLSEAVHCERGEECGADQLGEFFEQVMGDSSAFHKPSALLKCIDAARYAVGSDDCTAVIVRMSDAADCLLETEVAIDPRAVSDLSEQMEQCVEQAVGDEDLAARVRLVAMEHAMNVVEHGGLTPTDSFWAQLLLVGGDLRLAFSDPGCEWNQAAAEHCCFDSDAYAENGRGVAITNAISDYVERYRRDSRNVVRYHFGVRSPS